jgi:hypothetical protein
MSSFERWLPCFFLLLCFAASSGVNGTKAITIANTAPMCLTNLFFIVSDKGGLCILDTDTADVLMA